MCSRTHTSLRLLDSVVHDSVLDDSVLDDSVLDDSMLDSGVAGGSVAGGSVLDDSVFNSSVLDGSVHGGSVSACLLVRECVLVVVPYCLLILRAKMVSVLTRAYAVSAKPLFCILS